MKGKLNLKTKIIAAVVAIVSLATCLLFSFNRKEAEYVAAASTLYTAVTEHGEQQFSAKFDGNILFSAEKVLMSSEKNYSTFLDSATVFYEREDLVLGGEDGIERYFRNYYYTTTGGKYVIDNGQFVMLNNKWENNKYSTKTNDDLAEVVLISFGQYIYSNNGTYDEIITAEKYVEDDDPATIDINEQNHNPKTAKIEFLNIEAKRNNKEIEIGGIRNVIATGGPFYDYMMVIEQTEQNEGYYEFNFTYKVAGRSYTAKFEFYLIFETSYTGTINTADSNQYNIEPTLGWKGGAQFAKTTEQQGYVRYFAGKDAANGISVSDSTISYPTVTYDYTKYTFKYRHTANGKHTDYEYVYKPSSNLAGENGVIEYTATTAVSSVTTTKKLKYVNNINNATGYNHQLVTIVLTDPGTYTFEFEYVYSGYTPASERPTVNLSVNDLHLAIHGADLQYSKYNYQAAEMRYLSVSANKEDAVDFIYPNAFDIYSKADSRDTDGKEIADYKNKSIGFIYEVQENSDARVGDIDFSSSKDTHLNASLIASAGGPYTVLKTLADEVKTSFAYTVTNITTVAENSDVDAVLSTIRYEKTNQGSLWFTLNDSYIDSYYFYSETPIDSVKDLYTEGKDDYGSTVYRLNKVTSETSFNAPGYYIIMLKIVPNGLDASMGYYQIFAFEYSTKTVNITVREKTNLVDETQEAVVGAGKFTNKDVKVTWEPPGVFERAITGSYYVTQNARASRDEMLASTAYALKSGDILGNNGSSYVGKEFKKFLIALKSEGESATYKIFTIDREAISGVASYVVAKMSAGNTFYYAYDADLYGNAKRIDNGITDGHATLDWNDKASGADINVKYTYTKFTKNTDVSHFVETWLTTNYELGTTSGNYSFEKELNHAFLEKTLYEQGIYLFTLTDEAGNSCKYLLVIDRTESFFLIDSGDGYVPYASGSSTMFSDSVEYNVGEYKAFSLDLSGADKTELKEVIDAVQNKNLASVGYYVGNNSNASSLSEIFKTAHGTTYLTVHNESLKAYTAEGNLFAGVYEKSSTGIIEYNLNTVGGATSLVLSLYLKGANNIHSATYKKDTDAISKIDIEINTDNARGMVYYSANSFSVGDIGGGDLIRLYTGSDNDVSGSKGIDYAHATNYQYLAFTWLIGSGTNYEVATVTYRFYALNTNVAPNEDTYYYTTGTGAEIDIYRDQTSYNGAVTSGDQGFMLFGNRATTPEGLYIVTRTYKNTLDASDRDRTVLNYYFIVDRNGIIEVNKSIGSSIRLQLMEDETSFNEFSSISTNTRVFSLAEDRITNAVYSIYLSTSKLPATIHIPATKYFNDSYTTNIYHAGKLSFTVYFQDEYGQLKDAANKNGLVKIFESSFDKVSNNGYYLIDIYDYLGKVSFGENLRERLILSEGNKHWLALPGTYIIRIKDEVEPNCNEKYIGFQILEGKNPATDILTGYADDLDKMSASIPVSIKSENFKDDPITPNYTITTSDEFVVVELPSYDVNETRKAQVDNNYITVRQERNGVTKNYIWHEYSDLPNAEYSINNTEVVKNINGSRYVYLKTYLRDYAGNIIPENLYSTLSYTVTIRYKLSEGGNSDVYKDCYKFWYNDRCVEYYYATYKITIDRQAPTANVSNLTDFHNDKIIEYYNQRNGTEEMFENSYHDTESKIYFTHQYNKYYDEKKNGSENLSLIYALKVNENTPFKGTDVAKVIARQLTSASSTVSDISLNLPVVNESVYSINGDPESETYGAIIPFYEYGVYYEILEIDAAGNTTQYVVYASKDDESLEVPLTATTTVGEDKNVSLKEEINSTLNMFEIKAGSAAAVNNGHFFRISLKNVNTNIAIVTHLVDFTTEFTDLSAIVADMFKGVAFGEYQLTLETRSKTGVINIGYFDSTSIPELDAKELIDEANKRIVFDRANRTEGGNIYYFEEIVVKSGATTITYYAKKDGGVIKYYYFDTEERQIDFIQCVDGDSYQITAKDIFDRVSSVRYRTTGGDIYKVEFAHSGNYYKEDSIYYGVTDATVMFDKFIFGSADFIVTVNGVINRTFTASEIGAYYAVRLPIAYDPITGLGARVSYELQLKNSDGTDDAKFTIILDTNIPQVYLRDFSTYESKSMKVAMNVEDADLVDFKAENMVSGLMNLSWVWPDNSYFTYTYTLRTLVNNNQWEEESLTGLYKAISEGGTYQLVIKVFDKFGTQYLGNKVYAFNIANENETLYYVKDIEGKAIDANSSFKFEDFINGVSLSTAERGIFNTKFSGYPKTNLKLFISNSELSVIINEDLVLDTPDGHIEYTIEKPGYTFTMHKVSTDTYSQYFGLLIITPTTGFVTSATVGGQEVNSENVNFSLASITAGTQYFVNVVQERAVADYLVKKNGLILEVYYNNSREVVRTVKSIGVDLGSSFKNTLSYEILGNGFYDFVIKDFAGNTHYFGTVSKISATVLREVVITINDQAPIDNAYYNEQVEMRIYASAKYQVGTVSVTATLNGKSYALNAAEPYVFKDYGTYKVVVKATFNDGVEDYPLTKVLKFSIINPKEVRKALDLTNIGNYKITKVVNANGKDVTSVFEEVLNLNANSEGKYLSYDKLLSHASDLEITAGKQTYTITYLVNDYDYPPREVSFSFTFNNEEPKIDCSLEAGKSTTKSFTITFNAGILYEQIGEAYIMINDEIVAVIDEYSSFSMENISRSYKEHGDGDYYIQIVSTSGNIWLSYKATIKEPLNFWAVFIIIVAVVIVVGVTVTIIVLRNKMRIR